MIIESGDKARVFGLQVSHISNIHPLGPHNTPLSPTFHPLLALAKVNDPGKKTKHTSSSVIRLIGQLYIYIRKSPRAFYIFFFLYINIGTHNLNINIISINI